MSTDPPPGVEHAVVRTRLWPIQTIDGGPLTLLRIYFMDGTNNQKEAVRSTILSTKRKAKEASWEQQAKRRTLEGEPSVSGSNPFTFVTWEECANIEFRETSNIEESQIRITFRNGSGGWLSALGVDADDHKGKQTMSLELLADAYPPDEVDRRSILHEFGHALGLDHEHQSPALRKSNVLKLNIHSIENAKFKSFLLADREYTALRENIVAMKKEVDEKGSTFSQKKIAATLQKMEAMRKKITDREAELEAAAKKFVKVNYKRMKEDLNLWNYTNFDTRSIMLYEIKEEWQGQPTTLKLDLPLKLSDIDQAIVKLMYPPDLTKEDNVSAFRRALEIVRVPDRTVGEALAEFNKHKEHPNEDVAPFLEKLRDKFAHYTISGGLFYQNKAWISLYDSTIGVMPAARGLNPASLRRSDITQFAGEVMKNKLFQSIVKNVIYRATVQRGIPTKVSIPGATDAEAMKMMAALSMNDELARLVREQKAAFTGENVMG